MEPQDKLLAKETFASLRKQVIGKGKLINLLSDHHYTCLQDGKQYFFGGTIILIQLRKLNKKFGELLFLKLSIKNLRIINNKLCFPVNS